MSPSNTSADQLLCEDELDSGLWRHGQSKTFQTVTVRADQCSNYLSTNGLHQRRTSIAKVNDMYGLNYATEQMMPLLTCCLNGTESLPPTHASRFSAAVINKNGQAAGDRLCHSN